MLELTGRDYLESYLARPENFEILEEVINRTATDYLSRPKRELGERLTKDKLNEIFPEVALETRKFLGVGEVHDPNLSLYTPETVGNPYWDTTYKGLVPFFTGMAALSATRHTTEMQAWALLASSVVAIGYLFYNTGKKLFADMMDDTAGCYLNNILGYNLKRIIVNANHEDLVSVHGTLVHELTHYLQDLTGCSKFGTSLIEGHAYRVEYNLSSLYSKRTENNDYQYNITAVIAPFTRDAYLDICDNFSKPPKHSLKELELPNKGRGTIIWSRNSKYALGMAVMSVAEEKYGTRIHRDFLNNDLYFLVY